MRRPVVNKDIVDYMRTHLQENKGHLAELEAFARKENIPIIQHEVVAYFRFLLQTLQPKKILEVGTAIGFSTLLMAEYAPDAQITTVDRNEEMIGFAKEIWPSMTVVNKSPWLRGMQQKFCKIWTLTMILSLWTQPSLNISSFCLKS